MSQRFAPAHLGFLIAAVVSSGCGASMHARASEPPVTVATAPPPNSPAAQARADSGRPAYAVADVKFMQGMIHHHAQAIVMARLARTHGAARDIQTLAERIDVSQRDEIEFMQRWLRERREAVPDPAHTMAGHQTHETMMPGLLTAAQMKQLESARGAEFDRLFLTFMIQHHQGALTMLQELFGSQGAAQDAFVFRFASDVEADQSAEIERMEKMLIMRSNP